LPEGLASLGATLANKQTKASGSWFSVDISNNLMEQYQPIGVFNG